MAATLEQLRARARKHADQVDGDFTDDVTLDGYLNHGVRALYEKLANTHRDYFLTEAPVQLVGTSHQLPADFWRLVGVDVKASDGDWQALEAYSWSERNALRNAAQRGWAPEETRYNLRGARMLHLLPPLAQAVDALVTYVPACPLLVEAEDELTWLEPWGNGWEEWAVLSAAITCRTDEDRSAAELVTLMDRKAAEIEVAALPRDVTGPVGRVQDVRTGGNVPTGRRARRG